VNTENQEVTCKDCEYYRFYDGPERAVDGKKAIMFCRERKRLGCYEYYGNIDKCSDFTPKKPKEPEPKKVEKLCLTCRYSHFNSETSKLCSIAFPEIFEKCDDNFSEWKPVEKPKEPDYLTAHKACGIKVGDWIKVTRKAESCEKGWKGNWYSTMDGYVGRVGQVIRDLKSGFLISFYLEKFEFPWDFPYFVLEKVEKQCSTCRYSYFNNKTSKLCNIAFPEIFKKCDYDLSEWKPVEKPKEPDYLTAHKACGIKEGDWIKVTRKAESGEKGWCIFWNPKMDECVGRIGKVEKDYDKDGFEVHFVNESWVFPYFVLEKVEKQCSTCRYSHFNNETREGCGIKFPKIGKKCDKNLSEWKPVEKPKDTTEEYSKSHNQETEARKDSGRMQAGQRAKQAQQEYYKSIGHKEPEKTKIKKEKAMFNKVKHVMRMAGTLWLLYGLSLVIIYLYPWIRKGIGYANSCLFGVINLAIKYDVEQVVDGETIMVPHTWDAGNQQDIFFVWAISIVAVSLAFWAIYALHRFSIFYWRPRKES